MKNRLLALLLALAFLFCAPALAVTLETVSSFAGSDLAAEAYAELLRTFEERTGHLIQDRSATSDESWKSQVLGDFAAGNEPDVLFFFAASADSAPILDYVVSISEINAAYPELQLLESSELREADGLIYAIPVRPYWEGLFVNTDLFDQLRLPLPTDWDKLTAAITAFHEADIVPIAVSLSDIPHYLAELAILSVSTPEEYETRPHTAEEVPEAWVEGMGVIRELSLLHAFPDNVYATTEAATSQLFRSKQAAMQLDGSWFANSIPISNMNTTIVLPLPRRHGGDAGKAIIGGVSMGFYLTRRAWEDEERREAAVALLAFLTSPESIRRLGTNALSGRLLDSYASMVSGAPRLLTPIQDDMDQASREKWLLQCVGPVASGEMTPQECWDQVMALHPFSE